MTPPIVKRFLITLDRHKLLALASFGLVVGVSGVVALKPPPEPIYRAMGTLALNSAPPSFSTTGQQIQEQGKQFTKELLLADNLIQTVATQVNEQPQELRQKANVRLPEEDDPPIIGVLYTDDNPQEAAKVVEALQTAMVEQSRLINTARLRATIDSIGQRLPAVSKELREAEQNLEKYNRTEGPVLFAAQDGTLVNSITASQQQQRQLQLTIEGIEAQMRSIQSKLGLTPEQAYASSALSADPIIANLRGQILQTETQIEILSKNLRPEHPQMVDLRKQQQSYNDLLRQRAAEVIGGAGVAAPLPTSQVRRDSNLDPARQQLANTLVNLQTQQETLQQQLVSTIRDEQELRQAYTQVPNKQLEQARRQQQVLLKQELFNKMQAALADAQAAEAETVSSLNIAQGPQVQVEGSTATSAPATIGVGIFVGLLVAGGLIFVLASLDNTYYTPEEVRAALVQREVPLLGELPYIVLFTPTHSNIPVLLRSDSPYQDFYERFRSNLRRAENKALKVVLLTSTVAEEGKSLSAYNLAIASAQAGKRTLLVEADLRSPSLAKSLGVSPDPAAAVEPLRYYNSKSECIRLVPDIENLYIVPSPGPQRQAAAIIESSELQQLLEDVRGRFDLVVVDTPALSRCNDALLLQPFTDGIVLVTRPGYTQETMLAEAVDELVDAELPLIGAIINGVDKPVALPNVVEEEEEDTLLEEEDEDFSEDLPEPGNVPTGASRF